MYNLKRKFSQNKVDPILQIPTKYPQSIEEKNWVVLDQEQKRSRQNIKNIIPLLSEANVG